MASTNRRKVEIAIAVVGVVFLCWWITYAITSARSISKARAEATDQQSEQGTGGAYSENAAAGKLAGWRAGYAVGSSGRILPSDSQIQSLAKTAAVDAGSTVNDSVFIHSFEREFAKGFRDGRKPKN